MKHISITMRPCLLEIACLLLLFGATAARAEAAPRFNCQEWTTFSSANPGTGDNVLNSVTALSQVDAWAAGYDNNGSGSINQTLTEHWDGTTWSVIASPSPGATSNTLNGITKVLGTNLLWAVGGFVDSTNFGQTLIEQWNGTAWNTVLSPNVGLNLNVLNAVSALKGGKSVWAVGYSNDGGVTTNQTLIEHWDGIAWSVVPSPDPGINGNVLTSVSIVNAKSVWAVGYYINASGSKRTLIEHWDGITWSVVHSLNVGTQDNYFNAVSVIPNTNLAWAVGAGGFGSKGQMDSLTEYFNGVKWVLLTSPSPGSTLNVLNGVLTIAGTATTWAVGSQTNIDGSESSLILQWNGQTWSLVQSPQPSSSSYYNAIASIRHSINVWAVGYNNAGGTDQTLTSYYCG